MRSRLPFSREDVAGSEKILRETSPSLIHEERSTEESPT